MHKHPTERPLLILALVTAISGVACGGDKKDPVQQRADADAATLPDAAMAYPDAASDGTPPVGTPSAARKIPSHGSAVAITSDDKFAVAANRTAGRVTVFRLDFGGATPATKVVDLDVGPTSEPWAVVIGNDDDSAFVILRREQQVIRIKGLHAAPAIDTARAQTGSEPTGIAISPTGATLYVANWSEGTVSVIDAATLAVTGTIDLNAALAQSGMLGPGVVARPALAHPRALTITNNGDGRDDDETIFVTEFFSQARTDALPGDDSQFDVGRQGVVYAVAAGTRAVTPITIAPVADSGFPDSKGGKTGCFPNQLFAAAINNGRVYVTAICESPRGPVGPDAAAVAPGTATSNFKTQVHAAVFVVDVASRKELPAQGLLLTREFDRLYTASNAPDDAGRRLPLIPNDIMFATNTNVGYVSGYGSDAIFRIGYKPDGTLERVGAIAQSFINLKPATGMVPAGELPSGIASANTSPALPFALAINESTRNLSVVSFATQTVLGAVPATDPPAPGEATAANRGRKFFVTGLGRWSLAGQAWNSCESCHPDGLTDNVTWYFGRGPRQTTSLDGTYDPKAPDKRRVLNWTGIFDEIHDFELNTRGNSGGVGALVHRAMGVPSVADRIIFDGTAPAGEQKPTATPQAGLNGSTIALMPGKGGMPPSALEDWNEIDAYVKTIRAPRGVTTIDATFVAAGKKIFEANNCAACHGGSQWTIATVFYTPNEANNADMGLLRATEYTRPAAYPQTLNPPSAATGKAPLRFAGMNPAANDQINCVLRDVGTFPGAGTTGVAPTGVVSKEVRQDMTTPAQGATGFNIPSLLGMVTGAPYYHNGSARTLEEALGDVFDRHRRAFSENFRPDAADLPALAAYLLTIDEATPAAALPALGFPLDLCTQTPVGIIK